MISSQSFNAIFDYSNLTFLTEKEKVKSTKLFKIEDFEYTHSLGNRDMAKASGYL